MLVIDDRSPRQPDRKAPTVPERPVHLLEIQEIGLRHQAHRLDEPARRRQRCAQHARRLARSRPPVPRRLERPVAVNARIRARQRVEGHAAQRLHRVGRIVISDHCADHPGIRLGPDRREQRPRRARLHHRVIVQQPEGLDRRVLHQVADPQVVAACKAQVATRLDQGHPLVARRPHQRLVAFQHGDRHRLLQRRAGQMGQPRVRRLPRRSAARPVDDPAHRPIARRIVHNHHPDRNVGSQQRFQALQRVGRALVVHQHHAKARRRVGRRRREGVVINLLQRRPDEEPVGRHQILLLLHAPCQSPPVPAGATPAGSASAPPAPGPACPTRSSSSFGASPPRSACPRPDRLGLVMK